MVFSKVVLCRVYGLKIEYLNKCTRGTYRSTPSQTIPDGSEQGSIPCRTAPAYSVHILVWLGMQNGNPPTPWYTLFCTTQPCRLVYGLWAASQNNIFSTGDPYVKKKMRGTNGLDRYGIPSRFVSARVRRVSDAVAVYTGMRCGKMYSTKSHPPQIERPCRSIFFVPAQITTIVDGEHVMLKRVRGQCWQVATYFSRMHRFSNHLSLGVRDMIQLKYDLQKFPSWGGYIAFCNRGSKHSAVDRQPVIASPSPHCAETQH